MDEGATKRQRWSRGQRFQLSGSGRRAAADYRAAIVASRRTEGGRSAFETARAGWATRLAIEADDGLYLGAMERGPRTIPELTLELDGCGPQRADVPRTVDRLVGLRLIEPVIPPPQPPPEPRRW
jgi:hypothetical protein